jgi:DNA-binding NtrC family response regulator
MDGLAAGRIMADMPSQPKIILMSGFDESVRLANRANLPVFAVLEKPLQLRTLSKFIRAALGNTTYHRFF